MSILSRIRMLTTFGRGVARGAPGMSEDADPFALFADWFGAAARAGILLPEAMGLSTVSDGAPSSRMVLLKRFDASGFVFYTNYGSRKALEIDADARVALLFHWAVLQRQVRIEGTAARVSEEESRAYFSTRARGSQVGAWASRQSATLASREDLEARVREIEDRFRDDEVPLPSFWGGYRVVPDAIEFWQGRANRLHDRLRFERRGEAWDAVRLQP